MTTKVKTIIGIALALTTTVAAYAAAPSMRDNQLISLGQAREQELQHKMEYVQAREAKSEAIAKYDLLMEESHTKAEQAREKQKQIEAALGFQ